MSKRRVETEKMFHHLWAKVVIKKFESNIVRRIRKIGWLDGQTLGTVRHRYGDVLDNA